MLADWVNDDLGILLPYDLAKKRYQASLLRHLWVLKKAKACGRPSPTSPIAVSGLAQLREGWLLRWPASTGDIDHR
jgi:hypothetical protein